MLSNDSLILTVKKHRGDIVWEKSSDCENWVTISIGHSDTLHMGTDTLAFSFYDYRNFPFSRYSFSFRENDPVLYIDGYCIPDQHIYQSQTWFGCSDQ